VINVLFIEDNPGDVRLVKEMLAGVRDIQFELECSSQLEVGLKRIARGGINIILLDLGLPDSQGFDTFNRVRAQAAGVPIILLTGLNDKELAFKAAQEGAQDYLVKGQLDGNLLIHSIRYAIERQSLTEELRVLSLVDELTGLYNRRGFLFLSKQQLKQVNRIKKQVVVVSADVDGLKYINDNLGHEEGDKALIDISVILRKTFRESDIIARLGGDEFAVIMIQESQTCLKFLSNNRLEKEIEKHNQKAGRPYKLSVSTGSLCYDPEIHKNIDDLLSSADGLMYLQKQSKREGLQGLVNDKNTFREMSER
jgi:two-component system cell cycle response regulator